MELSDADLITELQSVKGYQSRKDKVIGKALGLLKKQGLVGAEIGYVYSNSIIGFIFTISAMDSSEDFAYFSNFGSATDGAPVDFCAPGVSIRSCYKNGGYATLDGTSMAAPHVAGILLLGTVKANGTVNADPDGFADPIAHR